MLVGRSDSAEDGVCSWGGDSDETIIKWGGDSVCTIILVGWWQW